MRIIYSHPGVSSTKAFCFFEQRQEFCFIVGRQSTFVRSKPFFEQRQELKVSWDNNEGTLPCWEVRSICFFAGELHEHIRGCLVSMRDSSLSRHKLTFASHLRPDLCLDLSQSAVHQYHFLQKITLLFIHAVMWLYFLITGQTSKLLSHRLREKLELLHLLWRLTKGFCNWSPLPQPVPRIFFLQNIMHTQYCTCLQFHCCRGRRRREQERRTKHIYLWDCHTPANADYESHKTWLHVRVNQNCKYCILRRGWLHVYTRWETWLEAADLELGTR